MEREELKFRIFNSYPLTLKEAIFLYNELPVQELLAWGNEFRYHKVPQKRVSWQIDRNINYTNVCISACKFCNFHCTLSQKERAYTTQHSQYIEKIDQLIAAGGNQILLQGGLHPHYGIEFYTELFKFLKSEYPNLKLNALGPPEVAHIAKVSKLETIEVLQRLREAGLDSLPGAGAEILSERVRRELSPGKPSRESWIRVMKEAHQLGINSTATMVYGHIESIEERLEHLLTIREIQNDKPVTSQGFTAFIAWPMQVKGTKLEREYSIPPLTAIEHLKMIAVSRLILNNINHIQVSWLTIGKQLAQIALHCGADDMGSIMMEENVVSSAGANHKANGAEMEKIIREAGFEPWLRNQDYTPYIPHQ